MAVCKKIQNTPSHLPTHTLIGLASSSLPNHEQIGISHSLIVYKISTSLYLFSHHLTHQHLPSQGYATNLIHLKINFLT